MMSDSTSTAAVATNPSAPAREPGLEGVVAFRTRLSKVDGARGELVIAGHGVEDLARRAGFEAVCALLFEGALPADIEVMRARLGAARVRAFEWLESGDRMLQSPDGMAALRALVARVPEPEGDALEQALSLAGALGVYASAWQRVRHGQAPLPPDPSLRHAADLLRMSTGVLPSEAATRALDRYLVTVVDHGANASTFAARVVASTGGSSVSAVVAAIGALAGPLHGGAPGPVLDMLEAVGAPERAQHWIEGELASGRRIMGMGHRVYRVRDPRAAVLEEGIALLAQAGVASEKLALARAVEAAATAALASRHPERALRANVEFYTAVILDAVGVHRSAFTLVFAASRTLGWCAHIEEQRRRGRLIRPASEYDGALPSA